MTLNHYFTQDGSSIGLQASSRTVDVPNAATGPEQIGPDQFWADTLARAKSDLDLLQSPMKGEFRDDYTAFVQAWLHKDRPSPFSVLSLQDRMAV